LKLQKLIKATSFFAQNVKPLGLANNLSYSGCAEQPLNQNLLLNYRKQQGLAVVEDVVRSE
jgi:hypothetical protein